MFSYYLTPISFLQTGLEFLQQLSLIESFSDAMLKKKTMADRRTAV
jgi:hypothetical protein